MRRVELAENWGDAIAINNLGAAYANGKDGRAKSEKKAVELYQRAADLGNAFAMCNLGHMYRNG